MIAELGPVDFKETHHRPSADTFRKGREEEHGLMATQYEIVVSKDHLKGAIG
jgi:hypothetical protein